MKPVAKKGLMLIGVLYTAAVTAMITNFVMEARPEYAEDVTQRIQKSLTVVQGWAHREDPDHIRANPIAEEEARRIFEGMFPLKGTIINVNFTLIIQCLNFAILLMILYGWVWDPMLRFLDERRRLIKERLDGAARNRLGAEELRKRRQQELTQLRKERAGIIEQAQSIAQQERDQITERARLEAERLIQQAQERLTEEVRQARVSLREELADLAALIASRALKREVSRQDHDRLIEEMADRLTSEWADAPPGSGEVG